MVAATFLLKRTGQADEAAAGELAEALGDLPLALEQAGAYMETTGRSLGQYLALFRAQSVQVLKAERSRPATDYPATVVTTWKLALAQVQRKTRAGAALLNLLRVPGTRGVSSRSYPRRSGIVAARPRTSRAG